jgi:hypothetical protein
MMVITPKHVGAVLMSILKLFLRQFNCASVGKQTNVYRINMHGMCVKMLHSVFYLMSSAAWLATVDVSGIQRL